MDYRLSGMNGFSDVVERGEGMPVPRCVEDAANGTGDGSTCIAVGQIARLYRLWPLSYLILLLR